MAGRRVQYAGHSRDDLQAVRVDHDDFVRRARGSIDALALRRYEDAANPREAVRLATTLRARVSDTTSWSAFM